MKYLIVLLIMILVVSGCNGGTEPVLEEETFSFSVDACSEDAEPRDELRFEISADEVRVMHYLTTYCNVPDSFDVSYAREGSTIVVNEVFSGDTAARCVCPLVMRGSVIGLASGTYSVQVYFDNQYTGAKDLMFERELVVP